MHPDAEADPHGYPLVVPGGPQHGCTGAQQAKLQANDDAYLRRTAGSAIAGNGPGDLLATITPITASSAPSAVPTARGITSHDGAAALTPPNHTNAKNRQPPR